MIAVDKATTRGGFRSEMVLQVHDELIFDCPRDELDAFTPVVIAAMRDALPLKGVAVVVDTGTGSNWLEAH
jgi:DNA polymerase-1